MTVGLKESSAVVGESFVAALFIRYARGICRETTTTSLIFTESYTQYSSAGLCSTLLLRLQSGLTPIFMRKDVFQCFGPWFPRYSSIARHWIYDEGAPR